jgi:hypothetical protein
MNTLTALKREAINFKWSLVATNSRWFNNGIPEFVREYRYFDDELLYTREKVSLLQLKLEGKAIIINGLYAQIESIEVVETFRVKSKVI